jgi:hypothetical protein
VVDLLVWWGVSRHPDETYVEFAHRAAVELRLPLSMDSAAVPALLQLAADATTAEYAPSILTFAEATRSIEARTTIQRVLIGSAGATMRLRLVGDPRLVFGQAGRRRARAAKAALEPEEALVPEEALETEEALVPEEV